MNASHLALTMLVGAAIALAAEPETTVCDLKARPAEFNHKSVTVKGILGAGFEGFSFVAPECGGTDVWVTYGGKASTGVTFCCPGEGDRKNRKRPLTVDGLAVPLIEDKLFKKLQEAVRQEGHFAIQVRGTFFSGNAGSNEASAGYGHLGFFTLLAIEQVYSVERLAWKPTDEPGTGVKASRPSQ